MTERWSQAGDGLVLIREWAKRQTTDTPDREGAS